MATIRYGARSEAQLRNREVEATSVDVWATTLVATYLTDPEVIAAVLPPPIEPPDEPQVKVTIATVETAPAASPCALGTRGPTGTTPC